MLFGRRRCKTSHISDSVVLRAADGMEAGLMLPPCATRDNGHPQLQACGEPRGAHVHLQGLLQPGKGAGITVKTAI